MIERLKEMAARYDELNMLLADPAILADQPRYRQLAAEHAELSPIITDYQALQDTRSALVENRQLLQQTDDSELQTLLNEEIDRLEACQERLEHTLRLALIPRDPADSRNVIMEIRAGAGGDEAALFAGVLFRMYTVYAEQCGWRVELVNANETELGGYKELTFMIEGQGAYSRLKYERGVHRVQRVPVTESGGRIHTSTVTVAVLPEVDDVEVEINPADLVIDTYRASGAGGQHVNRTDSAIRITHKPSGLVVTCQDQRSQYKNKDRAMAVLKARLYEIENDRRAGSIASDRRSQVGTGDRSERIRTYNYHQGRVTDHRIGLTLYRLDAILAGDLADLIQALQLGLQQEEDSTANA